LKKRQTNLLQGTLDLLVLKALALEPKVLILDEPTEHMDAIEVERLFSRIRRLTAENRTVVLTTHYLDEAETLCDRVAIMDGGHVIALATPARLVQDLLAKGFHKERVEALANLEDVFIDLTGKDLRED